MASEKRHSRGSDFKGFAKDEEVAKINQAVVDLKNKFNLCMDEDDIEKCLEVVPEELTKEKLLELEQEHVAEEEERKLQEKKKQNP